MIEKLKTAALTILVLLSLLQSYLLAYSYPKFDPVTPDEYVKTDLLGTQATLDDMLFPDQLVLHLGKEQHSVVYPNSAKYNEIWDTVKQRFLEGFRKTTTTALNLNWDDVRGKQQGVEVRFRDGLPLHLLQRTMQLKGDLPSDTDLITRIWIFTKDTNEVRAILFTDTANTVYEVMKANFTTKDIERFAAVEADYTPYKVTAGDYYLPMKPITASGYKMGYTQFTVDQMKLTFFVDPAITRNLTERDGTEIYTDGKRGLQLKNEQHWMTYSDPVAPSPDNKFDLRENLLSAVQFINQHGGWNGTYAVQKVPQQRLLLSSQAFLFRQYYDSFPIINPRSENIGFIRITLQKGIVSSYERSIMTPDPRNMTRTEVQLAGGEALDELLKQFSTQKTQFYSVFPAYRPIVMSQSIELVPAWAVELRDGTYEFLE
ncbi:YycH family regulatory protein [Paenibacillus allorhizosphaerae]|uniref:Two-component system WalR/WalK regulatory protein YycH n=1 Tax=Paenibacillus allorhizosphaerae TaxID=2849866 RepID=A0ABN7TSF6_9BACL|nr:two-component system activity regulator YycH [Paenibacillus allorhizosphaerae]CAG7654064.1 Two-component system WalR/WalK regulatory protein YycH [Paenibacillus allorhizosphaerae]